MLHLAARILQRLRQLLRAGTIVRRLRAFVERLADLPDIGLITLEAVEILRTGGKVGKSA